MFCSVLQFSNNACVLDGLIKEQQTCLMELAGQKFPKSFHQRPVITILDEEKEEDITNDDNDEGSLLCRSDDDGEGS